MIRTMKIYSRDEYAFACAQMKYEREALGFRYQHPPGPAPRKWFRDSKNKFLPAKAAR